MPGCHPCISLTLKLNLGLNILIIVSACQVLSFQPRKLCLTMIKLQEEWRIPWTSCKIFAWFTHAFLSSFTIIITNALINQTVSYYAITNFTLFGIETVKFHYSDDIIVVTLNLGSTSVSCNNTILVTGIYILLKPYIKETKCAV